MVLTYLSGGLFLLGAHGRKRARNFENCLAGAAHGTELAKDGETNGANETDVDQLAVAETGGAVVDLCGRRKTQLTSTEICIRQECPEEKL
jgi:hypothetical protein